MNEPLEADVLEQLRLARDETRAHCGQLGEAYDGVTMTQARYLLQHLGRKLGCLAEAVRFVVKNEAMLRSPRRKAFLLAAACDLIEEEGAGGAAPISPAVPS